MSNNLRKAAVRGVFYPKNFSEITTTINKYNREFDRLNIDKKIRSIVPNAVIVPHAGYIFSGATANFAYRFLSKSVAKRLIVIGPSHHYYFKGISCAHYDNFETPCGALDFDLPYLTALSKTFDLTFEMKAHRNEHSTEVQMPFIQHYFPHSKIIELVYGDIDTHKLAQVIVALLNSTDNAIIISSDLSHFYSLTEAKKHDTACLRAVEKIDIKHFKKECEACGLIGIEAMLIAAHHLKLHSSLLDYKTSFDANRDETSVVGYMSAMFYRPDITQ